MKYEPANLVKYDEISKDTLGNPVRARNAFTSSNVRATQWTADDVAVLGREMTTTTRKLLTRETLANLKQASHIELDGHDYEIEKVSNLGRWRLIYIKNYRE